MSNKGSICQGHKHSDLKVTVNANRQKQAEDEEELNNIEQFNKNFLLKNALKIEQIKKLNPKQKLPIFKDKNGCYVWMNRAQRRKKNIRTV